MKAIGQYIKNVFLGLDYFVNALTLGDPQETISSRIGKKRSRGGDCRICVWLCSFLDKIDPRHCQKSINPDQGRGSDDDDSVLGIGS